jgi:hypothetical protein
MEKSNKNNSKDSNKPDSKRQAIDKKHKQPSSDGNKAKFEQLLDDAILGIKRK